MTLQLFDKGCKAKQFQLAHDALGLRKRSGPCAPQTPVAMTQKEESDHRTGGGAGVELDVRARPHPTLADERRPLPGGGATGTRRIRGPSAPQTPVGMTQRVVSTDLMVN